MANLYTQNSFISLQNTSKQSMI